MMSLGRSHRLQLLSRLDRLERQGVRWTAEEVASCYTMEQFLDYLEARRESEVAAPATASKSAGAPPSGPPPSTPTPMSTSSPSATSTTADGRPVPHAGGGDPPEDRDDGRPVPQEDRNDQPEVHPPSSTPAPEEAEPGEDSTGSRTDLPATNDARQSAVDRFLL